MMKFRTEVFPSDTGFSIEHGTGILFVGSCFSENIGYRLEKLKFDIERNPFGILYNPASILMNLNALLTKKQFFESDLFENKGLWCSFSHHGSFSNTNKEKCLEAINLRVAKGSEMLHKAGILFITLGTSWVYVSADSSQVVANCHKLPSGMFERKALTVKEIVEGFSEFNDILLRRNPDIKIVFTISPIRHWKDGATANQLSKSTLIVAVHELISLYKNVCYFPAYEIMMDDLRDYRFYSDDLLHPSNFAINYIWEKFSQTYFSEPTIELNNTIMAILKATEHRPINPNTEQHKVFIKRQIELMEEMNHLYPYLDFSQEKAKLLGS